MQAIVTISRALRLLRVLDPDEAPEAADAKTALEALNKMMRRWEADGIALGWNTLASVDDEMTIPEEAEDAVDHNLALRMRKEFGVAIDPDLVSDANSLLNALRRDVNVANPLAHESPGWGYDTRSDSYYGGRP